MIGKVEAVKIPMKTFTPIGSMVALHVYRQDITEGGVVLPDDAAGTDTPVALVIAAGPECKQVREGDKVMCYGDTMAKKFRYKGHKYIMLKEEYLAGVVDEPSSYEIISEKEDKKKHS